MTPDRLRTIRRGVYRTQGEFAELLTALRGVPVSRRTIEKWESGAPRESAIPLYNTDIDAIKRATRPQKRFCAACAVAGRKRRTVVRKGKRDLCGPCAGAKMSSRVA